MPSAPEPPASPEGEHRASAMTGHDPTVGTSQNYRRFSEREARGRSSAYEELAAEVADDARILSFLGGLPAEKRQPNLLFAAATLLLGRAPEIASLRDLVVGRAPELETVLRARRTQTNEPARCATILPALTSIEGPLALIEVGASAGLTLLFDAYSYDYDGRVVHGLDPRAPTLSCRTIGDVPVPERVPQISWRAGLDLNPLDVNDDEDVRWLSCLIWPGQRDRSERLESAVAAARRAPPPVRAGDLTRDLESLASDAPKTATLVVYHSAVLAYVDLDGRRALAAAVARLGAIWLSNEAPGVLEGAWPEERGAKHSGEEGFVLVRDGTEPVARTDPHGTWLEWLT